MSDQAEALVQAAVDAEIEQRARLVFESMGLSVPEALRIFLTRTAEDGVAPFELAEDAGDYDTWFREQVGRALADDTTPMDDADVSRRFAQLRRDAVHGLRRP